jgi:hypothetical protein
MKIIRVPSDPHQSLVFGFEETMTLSNDEILLFVVDTETPSDEMLSAVTILTQSKVTELIFSDKSGSPSFLAVTHSALRKLGGIDNSLRGTQLLQGLYRMAKEQRSCNAIHVPSPTKGTKESNMPTSE